MKRVLFILLLLVSVRASAADYAAWQPSSKTDKGLIGGTVGRGRMYFDISLPGLTSSALVDLGMSMSHLPGVIGQVPRWFTMFSPTACPYSELYAAPKSTIMITFRIYF